MEPNLKNYDKHNIPTSIEKAGSTKASRVHRDIFNKIVDIRKANTENIDDREYLIKEIRALQKELYCHLLLNLPDSNRAKVDLIHKYLCEMGKIYRDP